MIVRNFAELFESLQRFRGGRWVFRGVRDPAFELIPKVGRRTLDGTEQRILEMFERELPGFLPDAPRECWELLALGQHHGLPTRLLDWSENPLVAAFFASESTYDREGVIYAMRTPHVVKDRSISPFEVSEVTRYRPRHITSRIRAQQGLFSVHPEPSVPVPIGKSGGTEVHRIVISAKYKNQLIWDLSRFGVNRASLFPDVDGLAGHIRWMYENYDPSRAPPP